MHHIFKHPLVVLKKKKEDYICSILTSESTCSEILEPTKSRFFPNNFITKVLFSTKRIEGSFLGVYENNKHLKEVYNNLIKII